MTVLLQILEMAAAVPVFLFAAYLALLTLLALTGARRRHAPGARSTRRFAVLVPAHDEQAVIERTLESLGNIRYPRSAFEIIVIADNCRDETARLARATGATVMERNDDARKGKGHALRWCLDRLMQDDRRFDAFVVIDADTVVEQDLLTVLNGCLDEGASWIQCSDLVARQSGSWSSEVTRIAFLLHNFVRPLGKMSLGLSAGLNGNGMCLAREAVFRIPWTSFSRVEDLEQTIRIVLKGERVHFAPGAVVYASMPSDAKNAETQRRRWEVARLAIVRQYAGGLLHAALHGPSLVALDMLAELVTPSFVSLVVFTAAFLLLHLAALAAGVRCPAGGLLSLALLLEIFHVFGGLAAARAPGADYLVLARAPTFIVWKLRLYVKTLLKGDDTQWIRTERSNRRADAH